MNWLIFVLITVLFESFRIFLDNYLSDYYFKGRHSVSQKYFYGIAFVIFALILIPFANIDFSIGLISTIMIFIIAGIINSFAGIPYYKVLELDDSTNLGIFIQLSPVLYLILGWLFLGETISPTQLVAFFIILSAPLLILFTTRKRSRKIKIKAIFYAFLYVLLAVISNLIFVKESSQDITFAGAMAFLFLGKGLGNLLIMAARPKWRRRFRDVMQSSHKKVLRPLFGSLTLSLVKDFTYRAALILAPSVALASATSDSSEPIFIFFMGVVLTIIWPNFGREKLQRKSIIVHLIATVLVVIGIILIQI